MSIRDIIEAACIEWSRFTRQNFYWFPWLRTYFDALPPEHIALMEAVVNAAEKIGFGYIIHEDGDSWTTWHDDESLEAHRAMADATASIAAYRKERGLT